MATFIPGITDYIPKFQNDLPNLGLIQETLKIKQAQYDANYAKIKSIEEGLLNAELSREDTKETRKAFLEAADKAIKKISTVDLSKPHNLSVAERIFDPLLNNPLFVKDAAATKMVKSEYQKGIAAKDCTDPKKCNDGYNPESLEALEYWLEDFKKMTPDEALKANPIKYVYDPKINERLLAYVKEIDPDGEISEVNGDWVVTTKMGTQVQAQLNSLLNSMIANDPQIYEYMKNKAYVQRNRFMRNSGLTNTEEANTLYNNQLLDSIAENDKTTLAEITDNIAAIKLQMQSAIDSKGQKVVEGSPLHQDLLKQKQILDILQQNEQVLNARIMSFNTEREKGFSSGAIDNYVINNLISSTVKSFTDGYAAQKRSVKIDANPYEVNRQKFEQDVYLENLNASNQAALAQLKAKLDVQTKQWEMESGYRESGEGGSGKKTGGGNSAGPDVTISSTEATANKTFSTYDEVRYYNINQAIENQNEANQLKYNFLKDFFNQLPEDARKLLFKTPDGKESYTFDQLTSLYTRGNLKTIKVGNTEVSELGQLYKTIASKLNNDAIVNTLPKNAIPVFNTAKQKISAYETASKKAIEFVRKQEVNFFDGLQKNSNYLDLVKRLLSSSNPDIKSLVKKKGDALQIDIPKLNILLNKMNESAPKNVYAPVGIILPVRSKDHELLIKLNTIIQNHKEEVPKENMRLFGANAGLDQLGNPQLSYPSTGYNAFVSNVGNSKATTDMFNFFKVISNNLTTGNILVNNITPGINSGERVVLEYLNELYSIPDKNNPKGILGFTRSENLDQYNEYNENKVTYKIKISPQLREEISKKTSFFTNVPDGEFTITVNKSIDQQLSFTRGLAKSDPYTAYFNSGGSRLDLDINVPGITDNATMVLYQNQNRDIIGEILYNKASIANNIINFTQQGLFIPEVIDKFVLTQTESLLQSQSNKIAKNVSGQFSPGNLLDLDNLIQQGLYPQNK